MGGPGTSSGSTGDSWENLEGLDLNAEMEEWVQEIRSRAFVDNRLAQP